MTRQLTSRTLIAITALGVMPSQAADPLTTLCRKVSEAARDADLDALSPVASTLEIKMADTVLDLLEDRRVPLESRVALGEKLAGWPDCQAKTWLAGRFLKMPKPGDEMLLLFAKLGLPGTDEVFRRVLAEQRGKTAGDFKSPARAAAAIRGLGRFPAQTDAAVAFLAECLNEKAPHVVRASTAEALGGISHRSCIDALLPHLGDEAIGGTVHRSLFFLTGQEHGDDEGKWRAWLAAEGAGLRLRMLGPRDWEEYQQAKKLVAAADPAANPPAASFYGTEFKAKNALFILDCSGSMEGARIEKLKSQMSNLLAAMQNLGKGRSFGIIIFSDDAESCFRGTGMEEASDSSIRRASRFVDGIRAEGGTAMMAALTLAGKEALSDGKVDAVFFLSDGEPGDGTPEQVLALAKSLHERHRVRFNTIEITDPAPQAAQPPPEGQPAQPSLLQQIAAATGGTHTIPAGWAAVK